jgi:hypothetical protein
MKDPDVKDLTEAMDGSKSIGKPANLNIGGNKTKGPKQECQKSAKVTYI